MAKLHKIQIRETAGQSSLTVDESTSVIRGVKVLGLDSANRRRYTAEAVRQGAQLYERCKVNLDHPSEADPARTTSVRDRFGVLRNLRTDAAGIWGDLHYNPAHSEAGAIIWWARNMPECIGLSHNAFAEGHTDDKGVFVVKRIMSVRSVDLVADPATTKGLFESTTMPNDEPPVPVPAPGDEGYEAHLGRAVVAILGDKSLDGKARRQKILKILALSDEGGEKEPPKPGEKSDGPDGTTESKRQPQPAPDPTIQALMERLDRYEAKERWAGSLIQARKMCESIGLAPVLISDIFLEQMARAPSDDARKRLIEDRRSLGGGPQKPTSAAAGAGAGKTMTSEEFQRALLEGIR